MTSWKSFTVVEEDCEDPKNTYQRLKKLIQWSNAFWSYGSEIYAKVPQKEGETIGQLDVRSMNILNDGQYIPAQVK